MAIALSVNDIIDDSDTNFFMRNGILKRISKLSAQGVIHNISSAFESKNTFESGSYSNFNQLETPITEGQCEETHYENDSSAEIKKYPEVFTLSSEIEKFNKYGEDIFDPDIPIAPNRFAIETAKNLIIDLVKNEIPPFRITPSIDEGLCMAFGFDDILAYLEIYNDGDIGIIAENIDRQETIINEDLEKEEIIPTLLKLSK